MITYTDTPFNYFIYFTHLAECTKSQKKDATILTGETVYIFSKNKYSLITFLFIYKKE